MFKIVDRKYNTWGILDTSDNVIEHYTIKDIISISKIIKIENLNELLHPNYSDICAYFLHLMRQFDYGYEGDISFSDGYYYQGIRDWGEWHNPPEAEGEMDYDWQELNERWIHNLSSVKKGLVNKFPLMDLQVTIEEKNYIFLRVRKVVLK